MMLRFTGVCIGLCMLACIGIARADTASCWQLAYQGVDQMAQLPRPPFTSYSESGGVFVDRIPLEAIAVDVVYRDDGIAVIDNRWSQPYLSDRLEPGPPLLGPHDGRSTLWLGLQNLDLPFPLIARVQAHPAMSCIADNEIYEGAIATHLLFPLAARDRATVKALWLDPVTDRIRKLEVTGLFTIQSDDDDDQARFADFEVELEQVGEYSVVRHVTWKYALHLYGEVANYFGEYYFDNYRFSDSSPNALLATDRR